MKFIVTCEHGGNKIPQYYQHLFLKSEADLNSHRGYDPGALDLFKKLSPLADDAFFQTVSRLLIETNRSLHHSQLFSEYSNVLTWDEKEKAIERYYLPYRTAIESLVADWIKEGENVLHISVHTFTPELHGRIRKADIGILYDPKRQREKEISRNLKSFLCTKEPDLNVRYNYPYKGVADGFTTYLRKKHIENYVGLEIEVNQKYVIANKINFSLKNSIYSAVASTLNQF